MKFYDVVVFTRETIIHYKYNNCVKGIGRNQLIANKMSEKKIKKRFNPYGHAEPPSVNVRKGVSLMCNKHFYYVLLILF